MTRRAEPGTAPDGGLPQDPDAPREGPGKPPEETPEEIPGAPLAEPPAEADGPHDPDDATPPLTAAGALRLLLVFLGGVGLALWLAPRLAPHLPAPVAGWLAPGPLGNIAALEERLSATEIRLGARIAQLETRLAALSGMPAAGAGAEEGDGGRADAEAEAAAPRPPETLARLRADTDAARARAEAAEAGLEDLAARNREARAETRERLDALTRDLAALEGRLAVTAEDAGTRAAALDALSGRLDALAAAVPADDYATRADLEGLAGRRTLDALGADLEEKIRDLGRRIVSLRGAVAETGDRLDGRDDALTALRRDVAADLAEALGRARARTETDLAALRQLIEVRVASLDNRLRGEIEAALERVEAASASSADALVEAESAVRRAALKGAGSILTTRVRSGQPFEEALAEFRALGAPTPPRLLAGAAATGFATAERLARRLPPFARAALEAYETARAAGRGGHFASWLRAQVTARPVEETSGEGTAARLSRIEARVREGRLSAALAEARRLPHPARRALAPWIADLRARLDGEAALERYLAASLGEAATPAPGETSPAAVGRQGIRAPVAGGTMAR